jgi:hypothetical protein
MMLLNSKYNNLSNELCNSIIATSPKITSVAIISDKGRVEEFQCRNCVIEKLSSTSKEMFFMENALILRMGKEFDEDLGTGRFTYVERNRRGFLSFPMNDRLVLVSFLTYNIHSLMLAKSITHLIRRYKKKLENMSKVIPS